MRSGRDADAYAAGVGWQRDAHQVGDGGGQGGVADSDELPYGSAIAAGVRLVMLSWATYPARDPHCPAGLSPTIVQRELRGRLGFRGVTITDALNAGALRPYGSTSNRAVLAAGAGMDLLLCAGQSVGEGTAAVDALAAALRDARLGRASFTASTHRVIALRSSLGG